MPNLERKTIVSADDFGKNSSTNKNILELLSLKKLHRVSVMVNGVISSEEVRLLLDSSSKLDLHLNFFSLLKDEPRSKEDVSILGRLLDFSKNYLLGRIKASAVEKDWAIQLERFHAIFGKYPDGLNSHEHVHFFPPYFKIISTLAQKSKITYLRFGRKDFIKAGSFVSSIIFLLKKIDRRHFLSSNLTSADFLISLDWLKEETALQKIKDLPIGEVELIVHPEITAELEFLKTRDF